MQFVNTIIGFLNKKRLRQIEYFRKHPVEAQEKVRKYLLSFAAHTEWGKKYAFHDIKSYHDYTNRIPVLSYEEYKPYIERLMKGEADVTWPGTIGWFAKSSGTTSEKSKFLPVSKESLYHNHYRGGRDVLAVYCHNYPRTRIFSGKGLTLGGSHQISSFNKKSLYGDLSAILISNSPSWAHLIRTPRVEIALMNDWEKKLEEITRATIHENVTSIAGVPSWNLVLLKYILEYTGKKNMLEIWPSLELFSHGGISFAPYKKQFEKIIPSANMHYMETYNASEGFFALQDDPTSDSMLLMMDSGIFYEFIPADQLGNTNVKAMSVADVKTNVNYAMVISTNAGLWRYIIGDTIMFTSLFPHKIKITGRTKHFINVFGEEIIIDNAEKALRIACERTDAEVNEYTVAPIFMDDNNSGSHEWLVEFEKEPTDINHFASELDKALMAVNSDYEAKRYKDITLKKPIVRKVKKGCFHRWMALKGKMGGQNKVPRLFNERTYVEELIALNQ